jgi:hypothetical protein
LAAALDSGGEHVAIVGVGKLHRRDKRRIVRYQSVGKGSGEELARPLNAQRVEVGSTSGKRGDPFVVNGIGPAEGDDLAYGSSTSRSRDAAA